MWWSELRDEIATALRAARGGRLQPKPPTDPYWSSDHTSEIPCAVCGGPSIEFGVPNEAWNRIIRRGGPETDREYLCVGCFALACCGYVDQATGRVTDHEAVKRELAAPSAANVERVARAIRLAYMNSVEAGAGDAFWNSIATAALAAMGAEPAPS